MPNFDPVALMKRVEDYIQRIENALPKIEETVTTVDTLAKIFKPFLPSSADTAIDEVPKLVSDVEKIRAFVDVTLPALNKLVDVAGVGATQATGTAIPPEELRPNPDLADAAKKPNDGTATAALNEAEAKAVQ